MLCIFCQAEAKDNILFKLAKETNLEILDPTAHLINRSPRIGIVLQ